MPQPPDGPSPADQWEQVATRLEHALRRLERLEARAIQPSSYRIPWNRRPRGTGRVVWCWSWLSALAGVGTLVHPQVQRLALVWPTSARWQVVVGLLAIPLGFGIIAWKQEGPWLRPITWLLVVYLAEVLSLLLLALSTT